jgi:hypothetical protein
MNSLRTNDKDGLTTVLGRGVKLVLMVLSTGFLGAGCTLHTISEPLEVGMKAPDFELEDQEGRQWSLAGMRADGPAVVVFYRGYW